MNHKTNVNTGISKKQPNQRSVAPDHNQPRAGVAHDTAGQLRRRDIDMLAADIEAQALAAQTLCEICFEEIDHYGSSHPDIARTMQRLDALLKGVYRNAVLAQESADAIAALVREGGAA